LAKDLGLDLLVAAESFAALSAAAQGTTLQGQETRDIFEAISKASRALGLSSDQTRGAFRAIEQIISKGTVQAEELRGQLGERLPGAFQIAAKAIGVTTEELNKMLEQGEVIADEFLPRFADELENRFGDAAEAAGDDAQAAFNRLNTALVELQNNIAESGLLDFLAQVATLSGQIAKGLSVQFTGASGFGEEYDRLNNELRELQDRRDDILRSRELGGGLLNELIYGTRGQGPQETAAELFQIQIRIEEVEKAIKGTLGLQDDNIFTVLEEIDLDSLPQKIGQVAEKLREIDLDRLPQRLLDPITVDRSNSLGMEEYLDMLDRIDTEVQQVNRTAEELGFTFTSAFEDAIIEGEKFSVVLQGLLKDIARIFLRQAITNPIADFFGGIFSPAGKAIGGPVSSGSPYIVGERGPELFVPNSSGSIVPNHKMGGGGDINIYNNVDGSNLSQNQLLAVLEANNQRVIGEIAQRRREGRL